MKRLIAIASMGFIFGIGLAACGGGGGSGTTAATTGGTTTTSKSGLALPTEISAVAENSTTPAGKASFKSKLFALQAATDPGTDYGKAVTNTFVNEPTLEQFKIIEEVLQALAQTKYADPANVDKGPYKAMVAWQDEQNGVQTKSLQPWVIDSRMITVGGKEVNRVRAWIEESMGGMTQVIKAEFVISAAAEKNPDGSDKNYGAWTLNVKFGDIGTEFFAAEVSVGTNGESIVKVHEKFADGGPGGANATHEVKAIFNKSVSSGFGQVSFPDWESCMDMAVDCSAGPPVAAAKYAYNADHIAVKKGTTAVQFKNRASPIEMTHRYGMFDSVTGDDIMKTKSFGFPVEYIDSNGNSQFAYYGAWQGRHELWGNGGAVPAGTTVTRQDRGPNQTETYTVSVPFKGVLTKRTPVAAALDDIKNMPVETWINDHFELKFLSTGPNGAGWYKCTFTFDPAAPPSPPTCDVLFTAFDTLIIPAGDQRKFVNIDQWDMANSLPAQYVYLGGSAPGGAGFYKADFDGNTGQLTPIATVPYTPADGDQLFVNIGGSIYIEYKGAVTGTGWVEKELASFDQRTWTPVFNDAGDKSYTLPLDREFYINSKGVNYIVKRTTSTATEVWIEIQKTANPDNASTFVSANTVFKSQWDPDVNSTYEVVTDPASANFMKLIYKTIGQNDKDPQGQNNAGVAAGAVVKKGEWGLVAYVGGTATTDQFNWEYPDQEGGWGTQQYLKDANGFVLLSDPIQLAPVVVTNNALVEKTLSLQYDGWMHGLPDLFEELRKNDFVMGPAISDKIINIPAGTLVTDAQDSTKQYLLKPLEVSQFLTVLSADPGGLDITTADGVDLMLVPNFVEHNMGTMPVVVTVKYSEGRLVQ